MLLLLYSLLICLNLIPGVHNQGSLLLLFLDLLLKIFDVSYPYIFKTFEYFIEKYLRLIFWQSVVLLTYIFFTAHCNFSHQFQGAAQKLWCR